MSVQAAKESIKLPGKLLAQALIPSANVYSNVELLPSPHFANQEPPEAQQLDSPVLINVAHLAHLSAAEEFMIEKAGLILIVIRLKTIIVREITTEKSISFEITHILLMQKNLQDI